MSTRILVWNGTQFDTVDSDTVDGLHSTQLQGLNFQHCVAGATRPRHRGLTMFQCYDSDNTPENYGNVISLYGEGTRGGAGELFVGWSGGSTSTSGAHAGFYVRSLRDVDGSMWSDWARVYTTAYKPTPEDIGAVSTSGGTINGILNGRFKAPSNKWFNPAADPDSYGIHMNNSDIIGINALVFNDPSNATSEGLCFPKSNIDLATAPIDHQNYDVIKALDGVLLFNANKVHHSGDRVTLNAKGVTMPTTGGSWINAKTQANLIEFTGNSSGSYHPFMRYNMYSGNVCTLGSIQNQMGFYGYLSTQTANGTNAAAYLDISSALWHSSGGFFAGNSSGNVKRTTISASNPSGGANGDIWIKY